MSYYLACMHQFFFWVMVKVHGPRDSDCWKGDQEYRRRYRDLQGREFEKGWVLFEK